MVTIDLLVPPADCKSLSPINTGVGDGAGAGSWLYSFGLILYSRHQWFPLH